MQQAEQDAQKKAAQEDQKVQQEAQQVQQTASEAVKKTADEAQKTAEEAKKAAAAAKTGKEEQRTVAEGTQSPQLQGRPWAIAAFPWAPVQVKLKASILILKSCLRKKKQTLRPQTMLARLAPRKDLDIVVPFISCTGCLRLCTATYG